MAQISNPRREAQTRLRKLEAEAVHARQRVELYRAKTYGSRPTSPNRLRELERIFKTAEERLAKARADG
jgi:hypothetical protein